MQSPLENPAWHALISGHAHLAITSGNARRYPLDIAAFIAVPEITPETIHDLAQIVPADNIVGMFNDTLIEHPAWEVQFQAMAMQMVCREPNMVDRSSVDIVQTLRIRCRGNDRVNLTDSTRTFLRTNILDGALFRD